MLGWQNGEGGVCLCRVVTGEFGGDEGLRCGTFRWAGFGIDVGEGLVYAVQRCHFGSLIGRVAMSRYLELACMLPGTISKLRDAIFSRDYAVALGCGLALQAPFIA